SSASAASTGSTAPGRRLRAPARRSSVASSIGPPGGASAVSRSAARADEPRDCRAPWARPPLPRAGAPAADADARRGPRHPERRDVAETRERRAPLHRRARLCGARGRLHLAGAVSARAAALPPGRRPLRGRRRLARGAPPRGPDDAAGGPGDDARRGAAVPGGTRLGTPRNGGESPARVAPARSALSRGRDADRGDASGGHPPVRRDGRHHRSALRRASLPAGQRVRPATVGGNVLRLRLAGRHPHPHARRGAVGAPRRAVYLLARNDHVVDGERTVNEQDAVTAGRAQPLSGDQLDLLDAYWRAANYLSVGQIYLLDNPLLREPLEPHHVKPRLLGHWGTTPGINFVYAHLNRVIRNWDLNAICVVGPGHGGPAAVANAYLEGTYSDVYPHVGRDLDGLRALFRQFSFPGGIPSHVAPETPGSIHEGGELGYALSHAYGAAFDTPDLLVCCIVGDGEAETGPLATSWHSNKFLDPVTDRAVLPILHLNGYKIANPTVLARIGDDELTSLLEGYGHRVHWVDGDEPAAMHQRMAAALDEVVEEIGRIQRAARV